MMWEKVNLEVYSINKSHVKDNQDLKEEQSLKVVFQKQKLILEWKKNILKEHFYLSKQDSII